VGPALGGVLIQSLDWRWVFWINVPAGLLGAVLGGAALLAGFVLREVRTPSPLVALSLFRVRAFSAGNLAGFLSYSVLFGTFFLVPFALERGRGESPLAAGLVLTTIPVALGMAAPLSGALSDRIGARPLTVAGMLVTAVALLLLALAVRAPQLAPVVACLALVGLGQGLFTAPNNSAIMGAAPAESLGVAGGLLNVTRSLGTSMGVALTASVLSWRLLVAAGHPVSTQHAPRTLLLGGMHDTLLLLAVLALTGAAVSLVRGPVADTPGAQSASLQLSLP
jgi:MFS family permease